MGYEVRETEVGCRLRLIYHKTRFCSPWCPRWPQQALVCVCLAPFLHELGLLSFGVTEFLYSALSPSLHI